MLWGRRVPSRNRTVYVKPDEGTYWLGKKVTLLRLCLIRALFYFYTTSHYVNVVGSVRIELTIFCLKGKCLPASFEPLLKKELVAPRTIKNYEYTRVYCLALPPRIVNVLKVATVVVRIVFAIILLAIL